MPCKPRSPRPRNPRHKVLNGHSPDGADPSPILAPIGSLGKLDPSQLAKDRPRIWYRPHPALKNGDLSVIWTHVPVSLSRTHDNRTPYAVEVAGGGRSSAISRKMSANRFLGMATSAIWKVT